MLLTCNVYNAKYFTFIAQLDPNFIGLDTVEHLLLAGVLHGTTNRQLCIAQIPIQPLRERKIPSAISKRERPLKRDEERDIQMLKKEMIVSSRTTNSGCSEGLGLKGILFFNQFREG